MNKLEFILSQITGASMSEDEERVGGLIEKFSIVLSEQKWISVSVIDTYYKRLKMCVEEPWEVLKSNF